MIYIVSFQIRSKKKKPPVETYLYKGLFHSYESIISYYVSGASILQKFELLATSKKYPVLQSYFTSSERGTMFE